MPQVILLFIFEKDESVEVKSFQLINLTRFREFRPKVISGVVYFSNLGPLISPLLLYPADSQ